MPFPVAAAAGGAVWMAVRAGVSANWGKALVGWGAIEAIRSYCAGVNTGIPIIDDAARSIANLELPNLDEMFPRLVNDVSQRVVAEINGRLGTDFVDFSKPEFIRIATGYATGMINERMGTELTGLAREDLEQGMKHYFLRRINEGSGLGLTSLDYPALENAIAIKLGVRQDEATRAQILAKERQRRHRERLLSRNLRKKCMWVYDGEADSDGIFDGIEQPEDGDGFE